MIAKCRYVLKAVLVVGVTLYVLFITGHGKSSEIETRLPDVVVTVLWMQLKTRLDFEHKPRPHSIIGTECG